MFIKLGKIRRFKSIFDILFIDLALLELEKRPPPEVEGEFLSNSLSFFQ